MLLLNGNYAKILGYAEEELRSLTFSKWYETVHPEDMSMMISFFTSRNEEKIIPYEFEIRLKHKKGHWVWVLNNGRVEGLSPDLKPLFQSGIILEISERKESEIELDRTKALLLQTNSITKTGGWTWNVESGEIFWTENTRNIYEMNEDYDPHIDNVFDFIADNALIEPAKKIIEKAIENQEKYDVQIPLISGKGNIFWARIIGVPEVIDNKLIRYYGTIQNIQDQKRNELQLQEKPNSIMSW